jgi:polysaccharide transporter, PST family
MQFKLHSLRHRVVQNAIALYVVQFADYLLPMMTVPYLSRVLGSQSWGMVLYTQSFAAWLGVLIEYGFMMSATRRIAQLEPEDHEGRARVVSGVVGGSVLLSGLALVITAVCSRTVPLFIGAPAYLISGLVIAITQGLRPLWFFQGMERMKTISAVTVLGRVAMTIGIFLLVHKPEDAWDILVLQMATGFVSAVVCAWLMYREIRFVMPTWSETMETLREGWGLFVMRGSISLYTLANTFILGFFVAPSQVSFYAGPERLNKAAGGLLQPLTQVLYPRMSRMVTQDKSRAAAAARISLMFIGGTGVVVGALLWAGAPYFIRILGHGYEPAIPVFRVLAFLAPLIAISNVLGMQWMVPLGLDKQVNRIIITAGVANVATALVLAPTFGPIGMAWSVVAAEAWVTLGMWLTLLRNGTGFWIQEAVPVEGPQ